VKQCKSPLTVW